MDISRRIHFREIFQMKILEWMASMELLLLKSFGPKTVLGYYDMIGNVSGTNGTIWFDALKLCSTCKVPGSKASIAG